MFKSIAQYHKLHKILPILAGKWAKKTDVKKLPERVKKPKKWFLASLPHFVGESLLRSIEYRTLTKRINPNRLVYGEKAQ